MYISVKKFEHFMNSINESSFKTEYAICCFKTGTRIFSIEEIFITDRVKLSLKSQ